MDEDNARDEGLASDEGLKNPGKDASNSIKRVMPVTEVREDRVICEWHTHMVEVLRTGFDGEPKPGDKIVEFEDGRCELRSVEPPAPPKTIGAPAA